jgi:hypothetical protein
MRRVQIGEQKTNGDRLDVFLAQSDRRLAHGGLVERLEFLAGRGRQPPVHDLAISAFDERAILPG